MTKEEKLTACLINDKAYDGVFFYAVRTTGIFCLPSCRSKAPSLKNILFFDSAQQAESNGFRPCKRCRPDLFNLALPEDLAEQAKLVIDKNLKNKAELNKGLVELGTQRRRVNSAFKEKYGISLNEYINKKRAENAAEMLVTTYMPIINIAYASGFESLSTFYRIFARIMGKSPALYRKNYKKEPCHDLYT